jgi:uridine kinase
MRDDHAVSVEARAEVLQRVAAAVARAERPHPLRVAIDGVDGAGKTRLADELAPLVERHVRPVIRASVDGFHRPRAERGHTAEDYYASSFDYEALRTVLLEPLGPGGDRRYREAVFDLVRDEPAPEEWLAAPPDAVLLCDGIFLHRPELDGCWDVTIFVAADLDAAVARAVARDAGSMPSVDAARERYRVRYAPAQRRYLAEARPQERADIVVDNTDPAHPVVVSGA